MSGGWQASSAHVHAGIARVSPLEQVLDRRVRPFAVLTIPLDILLELRECLAQEILVRVLLVVVPQRHRDVRHLGVRRAGVRVGAERRYDRGAEVAVGLFTNMSDYVGLNRIKSD